MPGSDAVPFRPRILLLAALVLMTAFAASYIGALHAPRPHGVPVALVGSRLQAQRLAALPGRPLDPRAVADVPTGLRALHDREVVGVLAPAGGRLYVAGAAGRPLAVALQRAAQQLPGVAPLEVVDALPPASRDPNGSAAFYLVAAWVFGGYLAAVLLATAGGPHPPTRRAAAERLGALAAFAVAGSAVTVLVAGPGFHVLEGSRLALGAAGILVVLAAGAATAGLQAAVGPAGAGIVVLFFVLFGNAASGGPAARSLLPVPWRTFGGVLPPGAGVDLVRSVEAFGGARLLGPVAVLVAWLAAGAALTLSTRRGVRRAQN